MSSVAGSICNAVFYIPGGGVFVSLSSDEDEAERTELQVSLQWTSNENLIFLVLYL